MRQSEIFTIPPHVAFVDALAQGLLDRSGGDPLVLARCQVLLPNRRAARALTDAFVRLAGGGGLLLPRLTPVGDLGDDSFDRFAGGEAALLPAIPPLQRRLELARLVRAMPGGREIGRSAVEALRLGDALGETLDALLAEEIDPERLRSVVDDADLAQHWQDTLVFLELVISHWPPARDAAGGSDGGTRVAAMIDALLARWAASPPPTLVVAAGVTGSSPPLVRLLAGVLRLPAGMVVLPGLDSDLSEAGEDRWAAIRCRGVEGFDGRESEEHPQFALKALLARLGLERADVREWSAVSAHDGPAARTPQVMAAMAPADAADGWHGERATKGFESVRTAEAATPAEEAQVIALALREALTTPGKTAALVTPDRALARRVAAHCRRWGVLVDDSAGTPLRITPPGALALALVEAMAQGFAPVSLLAVMKHPLVQSGDTRLAWLQSVRLLDRALRGVRPPPGLDAIGEALDRWLADTHRDDAPALNHWWEGAAALLDPLAVLAERRDIDLPLLAGALRQVGTALCGDRLWAGTDGRALAALVEALETGGASFGKFPVDDAPALVAALLSDIAVRPAYGGHPRIAILGPLEARLQRADLMILGGLSEGIWPGRPSPDPWLAPAIRSRLGLPGLARAIGLAAQDFTGALGAADVLITRARRDASAPLVPSRFWLRLQAFAGLAPDDRLLLLARRLDSRGGRTRIDPPRPTPPLGRRPHRLSVTEVDTLTADPFAFYAKRMLRLSKLDPLDQDPTAATRGTRMHDVLEQWIKGGSGSLARLDQLAEAMLQAEGALFPLLRALWAPRARRALRWAGETVLAREADGWHAVAAEAGGVLRLPNGIELKGRADRIDRHDDTGLAVIDYKTGRTPTAAQVQGGFASQLGLLLAMAAGGELMTSQGVRVATGVPGAVAYWKLSGGKEPGKIVDPLAGKSAMTAAELVDFVLNHVEELTTALLLRETPLRPKVVPGLGWDDFDHLARVREWQDRPRRRR
ncbi:MAG: double-strand break repair protein AddB [Polymorphobacter sp.]